MLAFSSILNKDKKKRQTIWYLGRALNTRFTVLCNYKNGLGLSQGSDVAETGMFSRMGEHTVVCL